LRSPKFLTFDEVIGPERLNCSESTARRMLARGDFPKPFRLAGSRAIRFLAEDVDRWMRQKAGADGDLTGEVRCARSGLIEPHGGAE
jgi:excisionase family DNA binding protein